MASDSVHHIDLPHFGQVGSHPVGNYNKMAGRIMSTVVSYGIAGKLGKRGVDEARGYFEDNAGKRARAKPYVDTPDVAGIMAGDDTQPVPDPMQVVEIDPDTVDDIDIVMTDIPRALTAARHERAIKYVGRAKSYDHFLKQNYKA